MIDEMNIPTEGTEPIPTEPTPIPTSDFAQKILDSIPVPQPYTYNAPQDAPVYPQNDAPVNNGYTMPFHAPQQPYAQPQNNPPANVEYTMPFTPQQNIPQQNNGYTMPFTPQSNPQPQQNAAPVEGYTMPFNAPVGYYPPQQQNAPQPAQPMPEMPPKKPRKIKGSVLAMLIGGGILLLAGLITGVYFLIDALTHRNVDLEQLYTIVVDGYDGYASAYVEKNEWNALEVFGSTERAYLAPTLDVTLDKTEDIANGDVITATVTYDESYAEHVGVRFQNVTFSITVEGLEEAIIIDPFEGVFVNAEGIAPVGSLTIEGGNRDLFYYYIDGDQRYFKNGDVVTVVATYNEDDVRKAGGVVLNDRADFAVSELPEYITSPSQLSDATNRLIVESTSAKMADRLSDNAYSIIYEIDSENFSYLATVSIKNVTLSKTYITYRKNPRDWGTFNNVHHLYAMDVVLTQDGRSETFKMYALATAHNVVLEVDGSLRALDTDVEFYMSSGFSADEQYLYDHNIGSLMEDYEVVAID